MRRKPVAPKSAVAQPPAEAVDPLSAASVPAVVNPAFEALVAADRESAKLAKVWYDDQLARRIRPPRYMTVGGLGPLAPLQGDRDIDGFQHRLSQALGSLSSAFTKDVVMKLASSPKGTSDEEVSARVNVGLAFITSQRPANELETTILLQYWLANRSMIRHVESVEGAVVVDHLNVHGALTAKLGNLCVRYLEAFAKLRGGGEQKVTVVHEHRHTYVGQGGQAIIGDVHTGGGGEGRIGAQTHALADASGLAVWSEDSERETVPRAGDERESAMSDARRPKRRAVR